MHATWNYLEEGRLPKASKGIQTALVERVARLSLPALWFAPEWVTLQRVLPLRAWRNLFAASPHERLRLRSTIDASLFALYGLDYSDAGWILRNCDLPRHEIRTGATSQLEPKGFWRVDKDKDPELRHTVLTLIAFHDLEEKIRACDGNREKGIEAFLAQNDGDGWMLPETLRLGDYGLGHDERAKAHQPVASRLGPRFYDWQLAQSAEESWRECHIHARNLLGEAGYRRLLADIEAGRAGEMPLHVSEPSVPYISEKSPQGSLFE